MAAKIFLIASTKTRSKHDKNEPKLTRIYPVMNHPGLRMGSTLESSHFSELSWALPDV